MPARRPRLRPGPAQAGDYYGRPVNLASRITGVARPGSVLVDAATKEAVRRRLRLLLRRRAHAQGLRLPCQALPRRGRESRRPSERRASGRLAAGDEQVVEELGGQAGLEQAGVDLLQGDVAAEGEAAPAARRPIRARRSTRPCAGPSPRRWRAAPRRRRGAARSRRRAAAGAGRRGRRRGRRPRPRARGRGTARPRATRAAAGADQRGARRARRASRRASGAAASRSP